MPQFVCVKDFEKHALQVLNPKVRDFYKSGADDENTLKWNKEVFTKLRILPRMLRDVTTVDITTTVLGEKMSMPLGIAPTSLHKLAHPDGEVATAKAAEAAGTIYTLSTGSTCSIEEVAKAAPNGVKWFQCYISNDRQLALQLVHRAEKAGFKALVLTADSPRLGNRRNELRNDFKIPSHLKYANLEGYTSRKDDKYIAQFFDPSTTWDDIPWLKSQTCLPIVVKGILTAEDALIAVKYGADAIQISNHGGRQIDGVPAPIEVLPEIVKAVADKVEIYIDGGISQGTDVFKALALGAKMVFFGRPVLWALACDGEKGVKELLELMRREISLTFALSGCSSLKKVARNMVCHESKFSHL